MAPRLTKKPEVVDVLVNGKPAPLDKGGMAELRPTLMPDGVTWEVLPVYLEKAPPQLDFEDRSLGHADVPIFLRVTSGAIKQTGIDTFRVWLGRGGIERQGNPWDPWAIATTPGDEKFRAADRPVHFLVDISRKEGQPQTINFPPIEDVHRANATVPLSATASSNLPVQYYVVSGPAEVAADDAMLTLLPIPVRAKLPMRISVGAFQWGRGVEPKVASAQTVINEFSILP